MAPDPACQEPSACGIGAVELGEAAGVRVDGEHVAVTGAGRAALDLGIGRDRVGTGVALVGVVEADAAPGLGCPAPRCRGCRSARRPRSRSRSRRAPTTWLRCSPHRWPTWRREAGRRRWPARRCRPETSRQPGASGRGAAAAIDGDATPAARATRAIAPAAVPAPILLRMELIGSGRPRSAHLEAPGPGLSQRLVRRPTVAPVGRRLRRWVVESQRWVVGCGGGGRAWVFQRRCRVAESHIVLLERRSYVLDYVMLSGSRRTRHDFAPTAAPGRIGGRVEGSAPTAPFVRRNG